MDRFMSVLKKRKAMLAHSAVPVVNKGMEHFSVLKNIPANVNEKAQPLSAHHGALLRSVGQNKNREAFAELFDYYAPRVKSFLMKGGARADQADELAQDVMLTVWQKAESFDPARASAGTWIYTVARNKRIDALRKRGALMEEALPEENTLKDETPAASEIIARQQETDAMNEALKSLPSEQADLLYKSFFEEKTHSDIAKETKLPLGTVKSRIRLALDKLRSDGKVRALWT
jgi:RNA polymerase sigma factor (sigma-70 family)